MNAVSPNLICLENGNDKFSSVSLDHLQLNQKVQLSSLLNDFRELFDDRPGRTTVIEHNIELTPGARTVRQSPYRLHPDKLKAVDQEIAQLLEQGIIEESCSPWAAPILVVPKPDGTVRLCTDFRYHVGFGPPYSGPGDQ